MTNCYVMPVQEMEERLLHQDEPHFLDGPAREQAQARFCSDRIIPQYEEFYRRVVERSS